MTQKRVLVLGGTVANHPANLRMDEYLKNRGLL